MVLEPVGEFTFGAIEAEAPPVGSFSDAIEQLGVLARVTYQC